MAAVYGTEGNDTLQGTSDADTLYGLAGNDVLIFGKGADQLFGGDGNDIVRFSRDSDLTGGPSTGIADGEDGYDILDLSNITAGSSFSLSLSVQTTTFIGLQQVLFQNFEELILESTNGFRSLVVSSNGQFEKVSTGRGNDIVTGDGSVEINLQAGDDRYSLIYSRNHPPAAIIDAGAGNDSLAVGGDFTVLPYSSFIVDLQAQTAIYENGVVYSVLNFENVMLSGDGFPSQVFGNNAANTFYIEYGPLGTRAGALMDGRGGNDTITGGAYSDTLIGGTAHDYLNGDDGADTLTGGEGNDHIFGQSAGGGDDGADSVSGGGGGDYLQGNKGNDTLDGGDAADRIQGGRDDDLITGGEGNDTANGNLGNDTIDGGIGNDSLRGGKDDDVINGGAGNDVISGDKGYDTLTGDAGADVFTFADGDAEYSGSAGSYEFDVITDFTTGSDKIDLGPGFSQLLTASEASLEDAIANAQLQVATSLNNYVIGGVGYLIFSSDQTDIDSIIQYTSTTGLLSLNVSDFILG